MTYRARCAARKGKIGRRTLKVRKGVYWGVVGDYKECDRKANGWLVDPAHYTAHEFDRLDGRYGCLGCSECYPVESR